MKSFKFNHSEDYVYNTVKPGRKQPTDKKISVFGKRIEEQGFDKYPVENRRRIYSESTQPVKQRDNNENNYSIYGKHLQNSAMKGPQIDFNEIHVMNRRAKTPPLKSEHSINYKKILTNQQLDFKDKYHGFRTTKVDKLVAEIFNEDVGVNVDKRGFERAGLYRSGFDMFAFEDKVEEQQKKDGEVILEKPSERETIDLDAPIKAFNQDNQVENLLNDVEKEDNPNKITEKIKEKGKEVSIGKRAPIDTTSYKNLTGELVAPRKRDLPKLYY